MLSIFKSVALMLKMALSSSSLTTEKLKVSCATATDDTLAIVRQRISQPKDAIVRFHLTLNGFIIKYLREKRSPASTEELLDLAKENLSYLRRIDGSQYKPTFTRVFFGTLERCPAFKRVDNGWVLDEEHAEVYKDDILKHIYRRLSRTTRRPVKIEEPPTLLPSVTIKLPPPLPLLPSPKESPTDEESYKTRKLLMAFPGLKQHLLSLGVQPEYP